MGFGTQQVPSQTAGAPNMPTPPQVPQATVPQTVTQVPQAAAPVTAVDVLAGVGAALPAELQVNANDASGLIITGGGFPNKVSIKGKMFTFFENGNQVTQLPMGQPLLAVIVAYNPPNAGFTKAWYQGSYVEGGEDNAPDCASANGVYPDTHIESPQAAACASCPKNQWGSGTDQNGQPTRGKACRDGKTLYVVAPDEIGHGNVYALQIPPSSFKPLTHLAQQFARNNAPIYAGVVQITFDPNAAHPLLQFAVHSRLDVDSVMAAKARAESSEIQAELERSVVPTNAALQPPAAQQPVQAQAVQIQSAQQPAPGVPAVPGAPQALTTTPVSVTGPDGQTIDYQAMLDANWTFELMEAHGYAFNYA